MRRLISRLRPYWLIAALVVIAVMETRRRLAHPALDALPPLGLSVLLLLMALLFMVNPKTPAHETYTMLAPVRGRWAALNSPGQKLPSHGGRFLGQYAAVDILQPATPSTPPKVKFAWRGSRPGEYPCFGEPVYSMASGVVVRTWSRSIDHRARNTWHGLLYMMTLEAVVRSFAGTRMIAGNHVIIHHDDGTAAFYAHLRKGSLRVEVGQRVVAGDPLGEVGNTGNSSEPHLHAHLMDRVDPGAAAGLKMTWANIVRPGEIEASLEEIAREPAVNAIPSMPRNGEIFEVEPLA